MSASRKFSIKLRTSRAVAAIWLGSIPLALNSIALQAAVLGQIASPTATHPPAKPVVTGQPVSSRKTPTDLQSTSQSRAGAITQGFQDSTVEQIRWYRSATHAAEIAGRTGRPILIYVRSAACHYCDLMQRNVWEDPDTARIVMREFVPLKLAKEDNPQAVEAMQVSGFPTTLIFSSDRQFVGKLEGYLPAERFLPALTQAMSGSRETK